MTRKSDEAQKCRGRNAENRKPAARWFLAVLPVFWLCSCAPLPQQDHDERVRPGDVVDKDRPRSSPARSTGSTTRRSRETRSSFDREYAPEARRSKHWAFRLGELSLDQGDYEPVEDQSSFGIEFSDELPGSWAGYELGVKGSYDSADVGVFDVNGSTTELYGGVVKNFGSWPVRPFVGLGLSIISVRLEVENVGFFGFGDSEDDSSLAGYFHAGVVWDITDGFFVGVDGRVLFGSDISLGGFETDADYEEFAFLVGFSY